MKFDEVLTQVIDLLQREGRVSYRALKRRFALAIMKWSFATTNEIKDLRPSFIADDEYLEDLKAELIDAKRLANDEEGKVLVWLGDAAVVSSQLSVASCQYPTPSP